MKCRILTTLFTGGLLLIAGCSTSPVQDASAARSSATAPLMAVLERFTAADVPALGSTEAEAPCGDWTNAPTPANLPGKGLAQHPMLYLACQALARFAKPAAAELPTAAMFTGSVPSIDSAEK